ncbi:MAG: hypothetical protein RSB76_01320 [Clostridia bacterium]
MNVELLRKKYLENVPESYTKNEIEKMSDEEILDMDYFLNEDVFDFDENGETVKFICGKCKCEEEIPKSIVDMLDIQDCGNTDYPPRFTCEKCGYLMYPEKYTSSNGHTYTSK